MYTTLEELLKEDILFMTEYDGFYYVKLSKESEDDTLWKVDKKTGKAEYSQFVLYLGIADKAKHINPDVLRKSL